MARLGPLPNHGTEHEIPKADGLEALRWAGDGPDSEVVALPWRCEYCGSLNQGSALYCGQFGPGRCGASRPGCDEMPRGVAVLRLDGSVARFV